MTAFDAFRYAVELIGAIAGLFVLIGIVVGVLEYRAEVNDDLVKAKQRDLERKL